MHVGRKTKRGRAIVVLILDEDLSAGQLEEVAQAVEGPPARPNSLDASPEPC
jgi:hypothetical protein